MNKILIFVFWVLVGVGSMYVWNINNQSAELVMQTQTLRGWTDDTNTEKWSVLNTQNPTVQEGTNEQEVIDISSVSVAFACVSNVSYSNGSCNVSWLDETWSNLSMSFEISQYACLQVKKDNPKCSETS